MYFVFSSCVDQAICFFLGIAGLAAVLVVIRWLREFTTIDFDAKLRVRGCRRPHDAQRVFQGAPILHRH